MKRYGWILVLLILAAGCPKPQKKTTAPPMNKTELEEYAVYSALIKKMYLTGRVKLLVIEDHTGVGLLSKDDEQGNKYLRENLPGLQEETFADFKAKNAEAYPLKPTFNLGVKMVLVSGPEIKEIFKEKNGWDNFYAKYPGSQGLMTLSRVGFNREMTQALVYIGNQSHWLAGAGYCVVLAKKDGAWTVEKQVMVWIS